MPCLNIYLSIGNARVRVFLLLTGIRMLRLQVDFIFSVLYMSEKVYGPLTTLSQSFWNENGGCSKVRCNEVLNGTFFSFHRKRISVT